MSRFEEISASLDALIMSIPDDIFSGLAENPAQIKDASKYFREAEKFLLLEKGLQDTNEFFIPKKNKDSSEAYKNAGDKFNNNGRLHEALIHYNKW
jgi:hypothetical protein